MEAYVDTLCFLSQPEGQQQFKNKKQPEVTENGTVWKAAAGQQDSSWWTG